MCAEYLHLSSQLFGAVRWPGKARAASPAPKRRLHSGTEPYVAAAPGMAEHINEHALISETQYEYEALGGDVPFGPNLLAGAFAGIMEHTVMYPIDAIKTRMQIVSPRPSAVYSGIAHALSQISATEGVRSLWKGMTSVILGAGPAHAVYFGMYEAVKSHLGGNIGSGHHPFITAGAGACATIASDALMNPFDVIKQRMQLHGNTSRTIFECAKNVYRLEGLNAFYISYPTTLTMTVPFTAIQFSAYESLSKFLNPTRTYDAFTHVVAGGLAGAVAAAATTPLDVIKTLLQTRGDSHDPIIRNCRGLVAGARLIYDREGMRGFMRGVRPRILATMPR